MYYLLHTFKILNTAKTYHEVIGELTLNFYDSASPVSEGMLRGSWNTAEAATPRASRSYHAPHVTCCGTSSLVQQVQGALILLLGRGSPLAPVHDPVTLVHHTHYQCLVRRVQRSHGDVTDGSEITTIVQVLVL